MAGIERETVGELAKAEAAEPDEEVRGEGDEDVEGVEGGAGSADDEWDAEADSDDNARAPGRSNPSVADLVDDAAAPSGTAAPTSPPDTLAWSRRWVRDRLTEPATGMGGTLVEQEGDSTTAPEAGTAGAACLFNRCAASHWDSRARPPADASSAARGLATRPLRRPVPLAARQQARDPTWR